VRYPLPHSISKDLKIQSSNGNIRTWFEGVKGYNLTPPSNNHLAQQVAAQSRTEDANVTAHTTRLCLNRVERLHHAEATLPESPTARTEGFPIKTPPFDNVSGI
jgi:hypothetical protein